MEPADTFGKYVLLEKIGQGAMKNVWRARDTIQDREVALKISAPENLTNTIQGQLYDINVPASTLQELRLLTKVGNHPNITHILDANIEQTTKQIYLAEELVTGKTLAQIIAKNNVILDNSWLFTLRNYARQLCLGLEHIHKKGIVHGDFRLENILIDATGTTKITDFGLAGFANQQPATLGSVIYRAPELVAGEKPTFASDMWQLGIALHYATTRKYPFPVNDHWSSLSPEEKIASREILKYAILHQPIERPRTRNKNLHSLDELIVKCLDREPRKRPTAHQAFRMLRSSRPYERLGLAIAGLILPLVAATNWHHATPQDHSRIYYIGRQRGTTELYSMDTAGHVHKQLTNNELIESGLSLSPDGTIVSYVQGRTGFHELIFRNTQDESTRSIYRAEHVGRPAWSPDSTIAAVMTQSNGGERLVLLDKNGSNKELVCPSGINVQWHPSGEFLTYQKAGRLFFVHPDGRSRESPLGSNVKTHAWTSQGLLLANERPDKTAQLILYRGTASYEPYPVKQEILGTIPALSLQELPEKIGYTAITTTGFITSNWNGTQKGIVIDKPDSDLREKIIAVVPRSANDYLFIARIKDLDGSGKIDAGDNRIYQVISKDGNWLWAEFGFADRIIEEFTLKR